MALNCCIVDHNRWHITYITDHFNSNVMVSRADNLIPYEISAVNLSQRVSICILRSFHQQTDLFLKRIVIGNEKWVLYLNVERKSHWLYKGQKVLSTAKHGLHSKNVLHCVCWEWQGVIHVKLLELNHIINTDIYSQQ